MLRNSSFKITLTSLILLFSLLYAVPNFISSNSKSEITWWNKKQLRLGLDLQGGSHILLQVDDSSVISDRLNILADEIRKTLRKKNISYSSIDIKNDNIEISIISEIEEIITLIKDITIDLSVEKKNNNLIVYYSDKSKEEIKRSVVQQSLEIIRRRIDEVGTNEPTIQIQGKDRILVQLPGLDDPERVKKLLGKTAKMNFRLVDEKAMNNKTQTNRAPIGSEVLSGLEEDSSIKYIIKKRIGVNGDRLIDAQASVDQFNQPVVSIRFDTIGARRFGDLTSKNINKRFAIVLDNQVISAPVIRESIPGGSAQISGNFTFQTANDLAILLRAGSLPAPLEILEERTVGPSLGRDSINSGTLASTIALLLVLIYMFLVYGKFGLIANFALIVNILLIIAILSFIQATLTLPGIAGIALTTGMAVDANILIFERIREESRLGRSFSSSIESGFKQALRTILDANITTFIAAIILFYFGSGPIKGFAVTLGLGVLTTMLTSLVVSRVLINFWFKNYKNKTIPI